MTSQIDLPVTQAYTESMTSPRVDWIGDAESKPAPGPLSRIQSLINTVELPEGPDRLGDPELRHGLLTIALERPRQESVVRTIPIHSADVHNASGNNRS